LQAYWRHGPGRSEIVQGGRLVETDQDDRLPTKAQVCSCHSVWTKPSAAGC